MDNRNGRKILLSYVGGTKTKDLHSSIMAPEYELLFAVLERAIRDATSVCSDGPIRRDAVSWINSSNTVPWSFLWVCESLYITPQTRRRIRRKVNLACC